VPRFRELGLFLILEHIYYGATGKRCGRKCQLLFSAFENRGALRRSMCWGYGELRYHRIGSIAAQEAPCTRTVRGFSALYDIGN